MRPRAGALRHFLRYSERPRRDRLRLQRLRRPCGRNLRRDDRGDVILEIDDVHRDEPAAVAKDLQPSRHLAPVESQRPLERPRPVHDERAPRALHAHFFRAARDLDADLLGPRRGADEQNR